MEATPLKKKCIVCGTVILSATFMKTGGCCLPCSRARQVDEKNQSRKLKQRDRYIPKREKIVYGRGYHVVAWVTFAAVLSVLAMTCISDVQTWQQKSVTAVRRVFFFLSLFFLFHTGYSYKSGKISLRGSVFEKGKSRFHFYTGILIYLAIAMMMLWKAIGFGK